jgi:predicted glutamine amidotransferase
VRVEKGERKIKVSGSRKVDVREICGVQIMSIYQTPSRNLACLIIVACLSVVIFSGPADACRMYATIGSDLPNGMLYSNLVSDPKSLYNLSPYNDDGWGIGYYPDFGDTPSFYRGTPQAKLDPNFTTAVNAINASEPQIVMAHIRYATSGCGAWPKPSVPNPHPFYRDKVGKRWLFEHNGDANKNNLISLMGSEYLAANPPIGSDIPDCVTYPVGSEYYFLYLLKNIEENNWNVVNGVVAGIKAMISGSTGSINFVMSDGQTLWAFRRGVDSSHTLNYLYDATAGYAAVASEVPSSAGNWIDMAEYQLIVLHPGAAPFLINDVRTYCPGDINGDRQVDTTDLELLAGNFGRSGGGDLDFDGDVDGADVAALIAAYGKACP